MQLPPPPRGIRLVWDTGVRLIEGQLHEASALDGKSAPLLALSAAALGVVLAQSKELGNAAAPLSLELVVAFAFLLASFSVQRFRNPPDYTVFVRWARSPDDEIREAFLANLDEAYVWNRRVLARKAVFLQAAVSALAVVVGTVFVFLLTILSRGA